MYIRFLFCNPKAKWKWIGSKLIRWADRTNASHFALEIEHISGKRYVYESVFPRSQKSEIHEWLTHYNVISVYTFHIPTQIQHKVYEWLESLVGKPYSIPQLVLIALCILKPINSLLQWAILNHDRALICTEVGSRFIEKFIQFPIKESHDKIGVFDMMEYSKEMSTKGFLWRKND